MSAAPGIRHGGPAWARAGRRSLRSSQGFGVGPFGSTSTHMCRTSAPVDGVGTDVRGRVSRDDAERERGPRSAGLPSQWLAVPLIPETLRSAGDVKAHPASHALELRRADHRKGDREARRRIDDGLTHEHPSRSCAVGDARCEIHGLPVIEAVLEGDRSACE